MVRVIPFLVFLLATTTLAAPVPKDFKKTAPQLEGKWKVTSYETNGRAINSASILNQTWTFEGDKLAIARTPVGKATTALAPTKVTIKTDPKKTPMELDYTMASGVTRLGIYSIEGDKLTICLALQTTNEERPTNFDGGQRILKYVFKRVSEKEKEKDAEKDK